jgi:hypothetical protein
MLDCALGGGTGSGLGHVESMDEEEQVEVLVWISRNTQHTDRRATGPREARTVWQVAPT